MAIRAGRVICCPGGGGGGGVQLHRNQMDLYALSSIQHVFFLCMDLPDDVFYLFIIITPHAQRERGKVIDRGVHIYIYMSVVEKNI